MSDTGGKRRYYALDVLRGLSILLMVCYHWGYDLVLYDLLPDLALYNPLLDGLQLFFASVFVAISGASSTFSRNNWRRGLKILLCALAVTAATYWFDPGSTVRFGILHFLGAAALLYQLLRPLLERFRPTVLIETGGENRPAIIGLFRAMGYDGFTIDRGREVPLDPDRDNGKDIVFRPRP